MRTIYLDYNATTPVAEEVRTAMLPFLGEHFGNPSSDHRLGRACHEALADARARVAQLLGAQAGEIVFTGGGTESNNLAIKGVLYRHAPGQAHVVVSAIEHPAVLEPALHLQRLGYGVTLVPCDRNGVVSAQSVADALRPETRLVSVMLANNEIGVVQPLAQISEAVRRHGALLHTDAAQAIGKTPVSVGDLGVDLLTVAGHKFYAPKGVGALYVRRGVALEPVQHGASQESGLRAGTENTASIVGLGRAAQRATEELAHAGPQMQSLRDRLQERLCEAMGDVTLVHGNEAIRLPNTLSISFLGVSGADLLRRVPEVCASTGAACHSTGGGMSATLAAIGLTAEQAAGTVRLSVGWDTTADEIEQAAEMLIAAWEALDRPTVR